MVCTSPSGIVSETSGWSGAAGLRRAWLLSWSCDWPSSRPLGRRWPVPVGLAIAASAAGSLILHAPVALAAIAVTLLSLGYDMTQVLSGEPTFRHGSEVWLGRSVCAFQCNTARKQREYVQLRRLSPHVAAERGPYSRERAVASGCRIRRPLFRNEVSRTARTRPETPTIRRSNTKVG